MSRSSTLAMCMTLCFLVPARAAIITVTSDSGGTGGPDCTIRDAITAANTDTPTGGCPAGNGADTIVLPVDATITLTEEDNNTEGHNGLPSITSEITIYGNLTTVQRDAADGTPTFRIFHVAGTGNLTLNGLTVCSGSAQGAAFPATSGGGIFNSGVLELTNSMVSGNLAAFTGGGIENFNGTGALTDTTVSNNSAHTGGGILNRDNSTMTLTDSTVSENFAYNAGGAGGGIRNFGTLELMYCTVSENFAPAAGGGISSFNGAMTLTYCTVSDNTAIVGGGGIWNYNGPVTLTYCTVSDNTADFGGGIWNQRGPLELTHSNVNGNFADSEGGGILNAINGAVTLTNSTVSGNSSGAEGGGIWNGGPFALTNGTISGNVGGGIFNSSTGTVTLANSIVANSTDMDCENMGTVTDVGYNIVEDGTCISDPTSFSGDPMLGPLQDNGGPTLTHALLEGSPAIDPIPIKDCVVDNDQRGVLRPQGDGCDIGSYELEPADPCADDDGDGRVTICHVPPGNTGNAHTINVSVNALPKHLAHGDTCGPCAEGLSAKR